MDDIILDLGTTSGIQKYLSDTPFASEEVIVLSGGTANFVYRIRLKSPYDGRSTLVVKHSKPYVMVSGQKVPFDLSRQVNPQCYLISTSINVRALQTFEVEALNRVGEIFSSEQLVTVPAVHRFDKEANVIILDDCGEDSLTLKQFMQDGKSNPSLSEEIGRALGEFLGKVHVWGRHNRPVLDVFETNEQAKTMSAWATYGRLISTLTGQDDLPALRDPPIDVSREQLDIIRKISTERARAMTSAHEWVSDIAKRRKGTTERSFSRSLLWGTFGRGIS